MAPPPLEALRLNANLDRARLREDFDRAGRVQVADVLEDAAAQSIVKLMLEQTPWGLSWQAGSDGPHRIAHEELQTFSESRLHAIHQKLSAAMRNGEFAFIYSQYQASKAANEGWSATPGHEKLAREFNHPAFLDFIRAVTGVSDISWADAQLTHYGPGQFLTVHEDTHASGQDSRAVAYVLNLCPIPWRVDWGGYLNFFSASGDIVQAYRPRFNALNLFKVPALHSVSAVAPQAPEGRLAITGWFYS